MKNLAQDPPLAGVPLADLLGELGRRIDRAATPGAVAAPPPFLDESAIATRYGIEIRALAKARRDGALTGRRVGRRVLLEVAAVETWIASRPSSRAHSPVAPSAVDSGLADGRLRRIGTPR